MEEDYGEEEMMGEGQSPITSMEKLVPPPTPVAPIHRILTMNEVSRNLLMLGKDETGVRYAYLMLTVTNKNLTDVSVIKNFKHLMYVDLSGNSLNFNALEPVTSLPFLTYLKASRNKIDSAAIKPISYLQVLILNNNQITETNNIQLPMLKSLELGDNFIDSVNFDVNFLSNLKELSLNGNQLLSLDGFYPRRLQKLFLPRNNIYKTNLSLSTLPYLKILHLRGNNITRIVNWAQQIPNLAYLNLRENHISKIKYCRNLRYLKKLKIIILSNNPLFGKEEEYTLAGEQTEKEDKDDEDVEPEEVEQKKEINRNRLALIVLVRELRRINKTLVTDEERAMAKKNEAALLDDIEEPISDDEGTAEASTDFTPTETEDEAMKQIKDYLISLETPKGEQ